MRFLVSLLLSVLPVAMGATPAPERKIPSKELPPPVLAAFRKAYPTATIQAAAEEARDGKACFEIESQDGRVHRDLLYRSDGSLLESEEGIAPSDLPKAIQAALASKYLKSRILEAERVTKGSEKSFAVTLRRGREKVTLELSEAGAVLAEEPAEPRGK